MTLPVATVAIPVYNGVAFLREAVASVLAQTMSNFELLIVDDCSTDGIETVLTEFRDPRIRFLRNECNLGPEGNWNRCLAEARGRYFKLLPQDDTIAPDCLRRQVQVLEEDTVQRIALVCCGRTVIDSRGRALMPRNFFGKAPRSIAAHEIVRRCLRAGTNVIGEPGSVLFRIAMARRVGLFSAEDAYVIDLDYWLRLLQHGDAWYVPEMLATFRISSGSWSVAIGRRQSTDFNHLMQRMARRSPFRAGAFDLALGRHRARLNGWLRLVFYHVVLERRA